MTVMTAAHRTDRGHGHGHSELARLDTVWAEGVQRLAGLSSSSSVLTVGDTGHHIELEKPTVVIAGLLELLP